MIRTNVMVDPYIPVNQDREVNRTKGKKKINGGEVSDIMERKKLDVGHLLSSFDGNSD